MRRDHGAQRELLPVHELRVDERVQLNKSNAGANQDVGTYTHNVKLCTIKVKVSTA